MKDFIDLQDKNTVYFLGRYWADGSSKRPSFECKAEDFTHLNDWFLSFGFKIYRRQRIKNGKPFGSIQNTVRFGKCAFNKDFLQLYEFNNKSSVSPHKLLKNINKKLHYIFWLGFLDGDGCIYAGKQKKEICFWGAFEQNWDSLLNVLGDLSIKYTKRLYVRKDGVHKSSCIAFYNSEDIINFCNYIYQSYKIDKIGLERKWLKFESIKSKNIGFYSKEIGISYSKTSKKWQAMIRKSEFGFEKFIGWFNSEIEAIQAKKIFISQYCKSSS